MLHIIPKKFIYFIIISGLFLWPFFAVQSSTINSSNTAVSTSNNNLTRGLVGWWTFDGKDVNATTVFDKSGGGKDGTKTAITPIAGKIGQAGKLNGSSSRVSVPDLSTVVSNTGGTVSFWINSNISHYGSLISFSDNKPRIYVHNSGAMYVYWAGSTGMPDSGEYSNGVAWTFPKAWKHIVFTWDASSYRLYVDNVLKDSDSSCSFSAMTSGAEIIGGPTPNFFNGSIDDFRVYNRSISASEVKQLYALGGAKQASSLQNAPTTNNNIKSGLVGWWTFDGKDVNATTVFDKSGQGNNVGRYGGVAMGTGKIGQAEKFDGVNDRNYVLDASTNGSLDGSGTGAKMSWSFWLKEESGGTKYKPIISKYGSSPYPGYSIERNGEGVIYIQLDSGSGKTIFTDMNNYLGKWVHVVLVSDGTQTCGYRNGVAAGTCQSYTSISNNDGIFFIGNDRTGVDWWKGGLDDVRIYNRALSLNEIKQLYALGGAKQATSLQNDPTPNNNIKSGLVGWWTFDGKDVNATKVLDKSGQGNHGTRNGGVTVSSGKIGQAGKFDGNGDFIDAGMSPITGTQAFTMSAWIKSPSAGLNNYQGAFAIGANVAGQAAYIGLVGGTVAAGTGNSIGAGFYSTNYGSGVVSTGWSHVVFSFGGGANGEVKLYVNGIQKVSTVFTPNLSSATNQIGRIGNETPYDFNGLIDDVRLYNRALSLNEIKQLYALGGGKVRVTATPATPVAVGDSYQGGVVAYILAEGDTGYDANTQHGLIAMASDQSVGTAWSNVVDQLAGTSDAIGTGQANTTAIVGQAGHTTSAAKLCDDLISGGYSDWYLPSRNELNKLYLNRVAIGGFSLTSWYWSSSESNAYQSWDRYFDSDLEYADDKGYGGGHVRAVRSF
ncbi:MAG: LamG-like jellyroll fold domain-containing protein [Patescibacteria group bacterium]